LDIKVNARYLELNGDKIVEYIYKMEPMQKIDVDSIKNHGFDFCNHIFTESQTILV